MQFKANDGTSHGSQMKAYQASQSAPADDSAPKSIQDDPKAMQLVDELKNMGYTADDVEQAMGGGDDQMGAQSAAPAPMPALS